MARLVSARSDIKKIKKYVNPYVHIYVNMAKRSDKINVRRLTKLGGHSIAVTIPISLVRELGWKEKQKVSVKRIPGGFTIRDWKKG